MSDVQFLNQSRRRRTSRNGPDSLWDFAALLGGVLGAVAVTLVTRSILARTSWTQNTQSLVLAGGGLVLGGVAAAFGTDTLGVATGSASLAVVLAGRWASQAPPVAAPAPKLPASSAPITLGSPQPPGADVPAPGPGPLALTPITPPAAPPGPVLAPGPLVLTPLAPAAPSPPAPSPAPGGDGTSWRDEYPMMGVRYGAPPRRDFDDVA